jgi:mRNA interferase HigB
MRLTAESVIKSFCIKHPESSEVMRAWLKVFKSCTAVDLNELKQTFGSADYVPKGFTVFNVGGNEYRIVLAVHYNVQRAYVRFIGTHTEYNSWTKKNRGN